MKKDAKLAKLDNMDEDDIDKIREKRKAQLIAAQKIKQVRDGKNNVTCNYNSSADRKNCFHFYWGSTHVRFLLFGMYKRMRGLPRSNAEDNNTTVQKEKRGKSLLVSWYPRQQLGIPFPQGVLELT